MYTKDTDNNNTLRKLDQLRESLPHGSIKEISCRIKRHRNHVYQVLLGKYDDPKVIEEAEKIITEQLEVAKRSKSRIDRALEAAHELKVLQRNFE